MMDPKIILERLEHLRAMRAPWENLWTQVSQYVMPNRGDFPNDPMSMNVGEQRTDLIYDSTAIWANEQFASGLNGFVVPPTEIWFSYSTGVKELDAMPHVREWLQHAAQIVMAIFNSPQSNFAGQIHEMFLDIGGFGTANMMIEERSTGFPIRYTTYPLAECYIAEGPDGIVDTLYRVYSRTAKQIFQMYGDKVALPEQVTKALEKEPTKRFALVHAIQPRLNYDSRKDDALNMPFGSYVCMRDIAGVILEEKGYREFPVASSRWVLVSGEVYGRSPAINVLPDIKMVNAMQKTVLKGAQKVVDPPLQMPDEGFLMPVNLNPGALNFYDTGGLSKDDRISPILTGSNPILGLDMLDSRRDHIMRSFFLDLMQLLKNAEMTATEILQRTEDRMRLMAPMVTRFQHEALDNIITRTFQIARRRGLIPEPPEEIEGIDINYVSQVARAQKATRLFEVQRFLESMAMVAQFKPEVLDKLNGDGMFMWAHGLLDAPMEIVLSDNEVGRIRQERARQQQEQLNAENARNQAPMVKAVQDGQGKQQ